MIYRTLLPFVTIFFIGCSQKHQINIGEIILDNTESNSSIVTDRYMSFTQEYYDNKRYPVSEYCKDKRALLINDRFSTETYLKITNERTKQNRVGKYPIWFLVNDDARNINCVKKSANFINEEPFVVSDNDKLTLKILQQNQEEKRVPIRELGVLIDFIGLLVPRTANFLLKSSNLINDPITINYLNTMENAFKNGDLDGTKSRDFTTRTTSIKIKLFVPQDDLKHRELGYIVLKPKYRTTLSTVDIIKGIPNFKYIFTSSDPRIEDIMNYRLKSKRVTIKQAIDNFKHLADEYIIDALSTLNVHLLNRFTSYDRGLILALALRETTLYKKFLKGVKEQNLNSIKRYLSILNSKDNPLHDLSPLLNITGIEYYRLMYSANQLIRKNQITEAQRIKEEKIRREEATKRQIELQGIENFLRPVARWSYIPQMFSKDVKVIDTEGNSYV